MTRATEHKEKVKKDNEQAQLQSVSQELKTVTEALTLKLEERANLVRDITSKETERASLLSELEKITESCNAVEKQTQSRVSDVSKREAAIVDKEKASKEKIDKDEKEAKGRLAILQAQILALEIQVKDNDIIIEAQNQQIKSLDSKITDLLAKIKELEASIRVLAETLSKDEVAAQDKVKELNKLIADKQKELAALCVACEAEAERVGRYHTLLEEREQKVAVRESDAAIWARRIQNVGRGTFPTTAHIIL